MAHNSVDVNKSSHNGCTALTAYEQSIESQGKSSERHHNLDEGGVIAVDKESLKKSIGSEGIPWACVRIEEPDTHARNYLEENQILRILETLLSKLVYHQPEKPLEFLAKEMEQLKSGDPQKSKSKDSSGI